MKRLFFVEMAGTVGRFLSNLAIALVYYVFYPFSQLNCLPRSDEALVMLNCINLQRSNANQVKMS